MFHYYSGLAYTNMQKYAHEKNKYQYSNKCRPCHVSVDNRNVKMSSVITVDDGFLLRVFFGLFYYTHAA